MNGGSDKALKVATTVDHKKTHKGNDKHDNWWDE
jgi:hypothetical protein